MTGGGFGGACIALCVAGSAGQVAAEVLATDARGGGTARLLSM
jgi:galactokinase